MEECEYNVVAPDEKTARSRVESHLNIWNDEKTDSIISCEQKEIHHLIIELQ